MGLVQMQMFQPNLGCIITAYFNGTHKPPPLKANSTQTKPMCILYLCVINFSIYNFHKLLKEMRKSRFRTQITFRPLIDSKTCIYIYIYSIILSSNLMSELKYSAGAVYRIA